MLDTNPSTLSRQGSLSVTQIGSSPDNVRIIAEPLERGFGTTYGNALRRILLSSLHGSAVIGIQIPGVLHEFSSIPHVREDVTRIILNLKRLVLRTHDDGICRVRLYKKGAGPVTASDIEETSKLEVIDKSHIICSMDEGGILDMELTIGSGKGYVPARGNDLDEAPIGYIPLDSLFSPVRRVAYHVESTRKGQILDYDKLIMTIETNGAINARSALATAANIMREQLDLFSDKSDLITSSAESTKAKLDFSPELLKKVEELELSVRSTNCLKNDNIVYIGDLILKSEQDMLRTANFGRKSLGEIKNVLQRMGLHLGMEVKGWPPENIEELVRKHEDYL